jgi:tRNA(Ile)-lysidine synthase
MEKQGDILTKIRSTILRYGMISPGDTVIVAVSGGPDSICLLDSLNALSNELELKFVAAHFNHGLRGDEDEFETQLSGDISASMGLPFETGNASGLLKGLSSLEEQARDARYAFLEMIRNKYGAQKIATGHNLNDQAETVLMRLLRGSGPAGLAGIPPVRDGRIIRPLVEIKRDEIMEYLKARCLPFALDSSNTNKKHLRNKIRLELMPMMLEYQPRLLERLGMAADIIRDENAFMESMVSDWIEREAHQETQGNISVSISSIKALPDPLKRRVIRSLLKQVDGDVYSVDYDHIVSVLKLIENERPQCSIDLPDGIMARKTYDTLHFILRSCTDTKEYTCSLEGPGTYCLDAVGITLTLEEVDGSEDIIEDVSKSTAWLDADKLSFPLIVRNFRHGDRFVPMGMTGHKKVKNFFIDLKVPSEQRTLTPLVISGDSIVWICGYRIDERFKVTEQTKRRLKITMKQEG